MVKKKKKTKVDRYIDALHRIDNKTVIVTGANSGLGFEIARIALLKGAKVIMACRSIERAQSAKDDLIKETGLDNIVIEQYDQHDGKSIVAFSQTIKEKYSDFYALILNAGILMPTEIVDEFHVSNVYRTNFIGSLILLKNLKDHLEQSEIERRIIFQGSVAAYFSKYNKDRFIYGQDKPFKQYNLSKLCITNLYAHYRDNNNNPYVKYLLCEPGIAFTNIFRNFKKWFKKISFPFLKHFGASAREGSLTACKLMCDTAANGDYYRPRGLFTAKGLPKNSELKSKYIKEQIISDGEGVAKIYESK